MKKISMLSFILVFALLLAVCGCAIAENAPLNDVPCQTVTLAEDDPDYFKELWAAELYNYKISPPCMKKPAGMLTATSASIWTAWTQRL